MIGFVQATETPINYFITHYNILKTVKHLNIASDSKCLLYSLSPYKQHTSVLVRTGIRKCLGLAKSLTKSLQGGWACERPERGGGGYMKNIFASISYLSVSGGGRTFMHLLVLYVLQNSYCLFACIEFVLDK